MQNNLTHAMFDFGNEPQSTVGKINAILSDSNIEIQSSGLESGQLAQAALSDKIDDSSRAALGRIGAMMQESYARIESELGVKISRAGRAAAGQARMLAADVRGSYARGKERYSAGLESGQGLLQGLSEGSVADYHDLQAGIEAYDERSMTVTQVYSEQFNFRHGAQDRFAEMFFPTVVIPNNENAYTMVLPLIQIQDDIKRSIDGKVNDFRRRHVAHAKIDPTILRDGETKLIPIVRDESADLFADPALIPVRTVDQHGVDVPTAPYLLDKTFSILGVCQSDAQLALGGARIEDAVDTGITLDKLYLKLEKDGVIEILPLDVNGIDGTQFTVPAIGMERVMRMSFDTKAIALHGAIKQNDGSDSVLLDGITQQDLVVSLEFNVNGKINVESGDTHVSGHSVKVWRVGTKNGPLSLNDAAVKDIVDLLNAAIVYAYDLDGWRTNSNQRQRGSLVHLDSYRQQYMVKRRAPITVPRPRTEAEQREATDLAALLSICGIRTTNDAIATLQRFDSLAARLIRNDMELSVVPNTLGIAHSALRGYYSHNEIDVPKELQNLETVGKTSNIQTLFRNRLRDEAFLAYVKSGYKAVADLYYGNENSKPLVLIGTDPRTAAYFQLEGDSTSFGDGFDFMIETTLNQDVENEIYMTFGRKEALTSGTPDFLHFGSMAWSAETVYVLPTHYDGSNSIQTTVQPCYLHTVHLPIMMRFTVKGLTDAIIAKTSIKTEEV